MTAPRIAKSGPCAIISPRGAEPVDANREAGRAKSMTRSVAVALAAGSILVIPFTLMLLELSVGKGQNDAETSAARVRRALRHALTTPVVLAPALGILLSLSGFNLGTAREPLSILSDRRRAAWRCS
jgi:hypothetical protein